MAKILACLICSIAILMANAHLVSNRNITDLSSAHVFITTFSCLVAMVS